MKQVIVLLALLLVLVGCDGTGHRSPFAGETTVRFRLPETSARSATADDALGIPDANELLVYELTTRESARFPIDGDICSFTAVPDGIYLAGLVYNPAGARAPRAISDAISLIGDVSVVSSDLESLPIGPDAAEEIDLGTLDDDLGSGLSEDEAATALGYEPATLDQYGAFDTSVRRLLNPDVNRNGTYDVDEGLLWRFTTIVAMDLDDGRLNYEQQTLPTSEFSYEWFRYIVWINRDYFDTIPTSATAQLPATLTTTDGSTTTELSTGINASGDEEVLFVFTEPPGATPVGPLDGDYVLRFGDEELFFDDISFLTPEAEYEGFIFPLVRAERTAAGRYTQISWKWVQIRGGTYVPADEQAVRLSIETMFMYFYDSRTDQPEALTPESFSRSAYYQAATADVTSLGLLLGEAESENHIRCDFVDRGGNDYSLSFPNVVVADE